MPAKRETLSYRIIKSVLLFCIALFFIAFTVYYYFTINTIRSTSRQNAILLADKTVNRIERELDLAEQIPQNISWMLESSNLTKDSIYAFLRSIVENNKNIYGSAIAFEPGYFPEEGHYFAPYAYRDGELVKTLQLGNEQYEYFYMDWYQIPKMLQKPYWTEPYYDEGGGGIIMSTYSVPFYTTHQGERLFAGIVTVDLSLEWLTDLIQSIKILDSGYAFLLSSNGVIVSHPNRDHIMHQTIFSIAQERGDEHLAEIGREMISGTSKFTHVTLLTGGRNSIYYTPLHSNKWSVGIVYPNREMFAPLHRITVLLFVVVVAGLLFLGVIITQIVRRITAPLNHFARAAKSIASGKFDTPLPEIRTNDEMLELHDSFCFMQRSLDEYIIKVKESTASKEKIESELRIAREIQMGMIPHIFPPFPNLSEIDLFAILKPAKEVGGDLYDFFLLDERHLCFAIGDVSGKGIPASLFMAVTRTLLRSVADKEHEPATIVSVLNKSLATSNESNMFVTFFLGIIDLDSGVVRYTNAGHNPPVYIGNEGNASYLEVTKSIPLGIFDTFEYTQNELKLSKGDKLFLYTDGITEAENAVEVLYGEDRLLRTIKDNHFHNPKELIGLITYDVSLHVKGHDQSDDLTMLSLVYYG
jgi:sigma-B regulation protein RsbU (phosphoserine phosphatase)